MAGGTGNLCLGGRRSHLDMAVEFGGGPWSACWRRLGCRFQDAALFLTHHLLLSLQEDFMDFHKTQWANDYLQVRCCAGVVACVTKTIPYAEAVASLKMFDSMAPL